MTLKDSFRFCIYIILPLCSLFFLTVLSGYTYTGKDVRKSLRRGRLPNNKHPSGLNLSKNGATQLSGPENVKNHVDLPRTPMNKTPTETNILIYNRVPKCGTTTLQYLLD
ncbi:hypothetical protein SK128_007844, partial [Halocaridina rubra]